MPRRVWIPEAFAQVLSLALCWALWLTLCGSASADDELDDLMGGFDDDFDASEIGDQDDSIHPWLAALPFGELLAERVDLSGSLGGGAVYNYIPHSVTHGDDPQRRTNYGNLSRLDLDGFLQLDVQLSSDWRIRAEALGWYDFVYRAKGRGNYGGAVLDVYEWQVDSGEVYITGPLSEEIDVTLGRIIVNWGRSDTFRIVDVVNPLDNKEPGLVDIEDLRRARNMLKLDFSSGPWSGAFLVIPERRYARRPPPGSDFFPDGLGRPPNHNDGDFKQMPDLAAKFGGSFRGWDFTLYGAYVEEGARVIDFTAAGVASSESNRFGLFGAAGNYTVGSWLFKIETAFLTDLHVLRARGASPVPESDDADRIDTMLGIEYFGPDSLMIALEVVNRHFLRTTGNFFSSNLQTEQSRFETALRISRPFFRERLDVTLLGLVIGERFQDGALVRASGDYELTDSWLMTAGILTFFGHPDDVLGAFDSNDRLFVELKYSF